MIDFEKIKMVYRLGRNLKLSDVQVLFQTAKKKSFAPGEHLIKEGSLKKELFYIRKGLIRVYKIKENGDEITTALRWESKIIASPDIILFDQASQFYYQALEVTDVFSMDYDVLQTLISGNPKLEANRKYVLQNILKEVINRMDSFVLCSPEERYLNYIKANPDVVNRVPDKYIANVLGITPVSLSRIRKRIVQKQK